MKHVYTRKRPPFGGPSWEDAVPSGYAAHYVTEYDSGDTPAFFSCHYTAGALDVSSWFPNAGEKAGYVEYLEMLTSDGLSVVNLDLSVYRAFDIEVTQDDASVDINLTNSVAAFAAIGFEYVTVHLWGNDATLTWADDGSAVWIWEGSELTTIDGANHYVVEIRSYKQEAGTTVLYAKATEFLPG